MLFMGCFSIPSQTHQAANGVYGVYGRSGKGNVDVEAEPWGATETALSAFELIAVVVVVVVMAS